MLILNVLETNCVNLGHASFLGVLRGAELKSSVCPAQEWPQMPQKSNMATTAGLKCTYVHIFWTRQGRNSNEMSFCMFSCMGNPMPYSGLSYNAKKLPKTHALQKSGVFNYE